ncbi:MAG: hypothetical protein LBF87_03115 [Treponema sp.]|nr:hypothetical protein [Treponema sp.]
MSKLVLCADMREGQDKRIETQPIRGRCGNNAVSNTRLRVALRDGLEQL